MNHSQREFRLTMLWALNETALGGFLHAFKIPVTGFLVGGLAVLIIGLIARNAENVGRSLLKSTALVLLAKAAASPHSPPMAYIAVAFQGMLGALLFSALPFKPASFLFGILAMLESALQKLIITTLVFGMQLWKALDQFTNDVLKFFGFYEPVAFSFILVSLFLGLYFLWGLGLGFWLGKLPDQIEKRKDQLLFLQENAIDAPRNTRKNKFKKYLISGIFLLLFALLLYAAQPGKGWLNALYGLSRAIAIILVLIFIVKPLLQWILQKWVNRNQGKYREELSEILLKLPDWRKKIPDIYARVSSQHRGIKKYREFVILLFVMAIYTD